MTRRNNIRGPSIEMMVKRLRIPKNEAVLLKNRMQSGDVDKTLDLADTIFNGYGVESIQDPSIWVGRYYGSIGLLYVNRGDTHQTTLCYDTEKNQFIISSWGDWAEKNFNIANVSGNKHLHRSMTSARKKASTNKRRRK